MNSSTGSSRHPHRTSLPVPSADGTRPTNVAHSRMNNPAGPVRTRVRTTRRTRTVLPRRLGLIPPATLANTFPLAMVSQYPAREATAEASRSIRNGSDAGPIMASPIISFITRAVPDLPFPDTDSVTSDRMDVTVPMDATVEMNLSGRLSGNTTADIDAPTVDVIPGNQPANVPIITPLSPGIGPTGSFTLSF